MMIDWGIGLNEQKDILEFQAFVHESWFMMLLILQGDGTFEMHK